MDRSQRKPLKLRPYPMNLSAIWGLGMRRSVGRHTGASDGGYGCGEAGASMEAASPSRGYYCHGQRGGRTRVSWNSWPLARHGLDSCALLVGDMVDEAKRRRGLIWLSGLQIGGDTMSRTRKPRRLRQRGRPEQRATPLVSRSGASRRHRRL